jgi:large subunit ribosomal protein L19
MQEAINSISQQNLRTNLPPIEVGQTVKVHQKIKEGEKTRVQFFEGLIIKIKGNGSDIVFTVRKIVGGVGVEKGFLLHSPNIVKVEILKKAKVRRSKLYYMRGRTGKATRLKQKPHTPVSYEPQGITGGEVIEEGAQEEETSETDTTSQPAVESEVTAPERNAIAESTEEVPAAPEAKAPEETSAKEKLEEKTVKEAPAEGREPLESSADVDPKEEKKEE